MLERVPFCRLRARRRKGEPFELMALQTNGSALKLQTSEAAMPLKKTKLKSVKSESTGASVVRRRERRHAPVGTVPAPLLSDESGRP